MQSLSNPHGAIPPPKWFGAKKRSSLPTTHYPLSTILLLLLLLLLAGCPKPEPASDEKTAVRPLEGVQLRLAVVDDPYLALAVRRVTGEWNAQTGSELQIEELTEKDLVDADALPADAVLCASHLLGGLAERQRLAPVPARILRDAEWGGIFELLKLREAAHGDRIMAVPFGSPVFCCYYRPDLLEKLGRRPPRTWAEYQELAELLEGRGERGEGQPTKNSPLPLGEGQGVRAWCGAIEPLAPGWAGLVLLARAAPYAKHRDNYSTLFNIETMEPLVAGPPFVQALEELVAATEFGPADPFRCTPSEARTAFWSGRCGMALSWPTAAEEWEEIIGLGTSSIPVGFCELPGSRRVFNLGSRVWDTRDDDYRVPLLAIAGRLGVVNAKSAKTDAAFQLLLWLSDSRMSSQISATSPATTLFRRSNLKSPSQWVENLVAPLASVQYGDTTEAALNHEQWLGAPRIPGRAEYLAVLDEAVAAAVRGEQSPLDALLQADKKWREINDRLGLDRQRAAYRHSLGLE